ncbi:MAG: transcription elongation factor GreB [Polyangiaceae bacterium]|nr:transcription elongation factor GreB [Polyangiaceae bacterium]
MTVYLTREGAQKLAKELSELLTVERPRVVQEVSDAAAQGDRSENAEYIYGKKRLREIDRRVRFLQKRLDACEVVEVSDQDTVRFGAIVTVTDEDGVEREYQLVGPDESSPSAGRISFQSPIGRALMKRRVGDVVQVSRPAGDLELEVIGIRYG